MGFQWVSKEDSEYLKNRGKEIDTLSEAKKLLASNTDKGMKCPCCGDFSKTYKRKFNSGMSMFIIGLYKLSKLNDFNNVGFSASDILKSVNVNARSMDYGVIAHFGLIQKSDESKWKLTEQGLKFVLGQSKIPKSVFLYKNKCKGFEDVNVNIQETLKQKFNLEELLCQ